MYGNLPPNPPSRWERFREFAHFYRREILLGSVIIAFTGVMAFNSGSEAPSSNSDTSCLMSNEVNPASVHPVKVSSPEAIHEVVNQISGLTPGCYEHARRVVIELRQTNPNQAELDARGYMMGPDSQLPASAMQPTSTSS